ncbi:hypothetical protein EMGBS8_05640 [Verrucomicrobiota bacterium]|nr:hypothetical protein EMGBS8_05640 [Verrucomicrobiota bacterium]
MSTALLFSGQGAQVVGMGKSLYDNSATAKGLYDRAAAVLPFDLRQVCFEGPAEVLTETRSASRLSTSRVTRLPRFSASAAS